jgi:hypothetical protein
MTAERGRPGQNRAVICGLSPALAARVRTGGVVAVCVIFAGCAGRDQLPGCDFNRPGMVARMADHTLVRMRRTPCYGWCPDYAVEIDVNGGVLYVGGDNVMTHGPANAQLSPEVLESLRAAVVRARRAKMPHAECACGCVADAPSVELTTWENEVPQIAYYDQGCEQLPLAIKALESEIDRAVAVERWIGTPEARRACFKEKRDCNSLVGIPEPVP